MEKRAFPLADALVTQRGATINFPILPKRSNHKRYSIQ